MELTEIFFDTNVLKRKVIDDFSSIKSSNVFESFLDFLGTEDLLAEYKINICEITLEEFRKRILEEYEKTLIELNSAYEKLKNVHPIRFDLENISFSEFIERQLIEYFESKNVYIISIPKNKRIFNNIITRAINKEKPFLGKDGESDKGFKDVILWESIIDYVKKSENKKFILVTKNKIDFPLELKVEFEKRTKKNIRIYYEVSDLQRLITEEQNIRKNILRLDEINRQELVNIINEYFIMENLPNSINENYEIENFVDEGNNLYSFDLIEKYEEKEYCWRVELIYVDDIIQIDRVIQCV